ncbi:MAG: uracil-DNA glycosylase [Acidobacteriota bacterium]
MTLDQLQEKIIHSSLCPRLVEYRQEVARVKRRAYQDWEYWGRPVPSFGPPDARLLIVGLAPGAHGANRTGRMFTGDASGAFLYGALHRFHFCNQPASTHRQDGLKLQDAYITAAIHCVPPGNKPTTDELNNCRGYLREELQLLGKVRVVVALGRIAWQAYLTARAELQWPLPHPRPQFRHGAEYRLDDHTTLIASYHPSQQNTLTGRLTPQMFDSIFSRARKILDA